ncbi:MAG: alpha/beta hydrolase [Chloroflexota bacterium]|jgi:pimeloyl-ACP methyl ester carboxylesterase
MATATSIYKSPEMEAQLMGIYDDRLGQWPVPYESIFLDTTYGKVHTIVSGPEDGPPVMLLHASGLSAWSWLYNVEPLNKRYRTYAIDTIGDAGKSALRDLDSFPRDGQALSDFYVAIADDLGIDSAYVVGASQGGFIGTNYALHAPERVKKLALLGPMGYAGTNRTVVRIVLATILPFRSVQDSTFRWAFGDDSGMREACEKWFRLVMSGVIPKQARPKTFSAEQLQTLECPVLLVLGQRDGLVGDPKNAKELAQNIPDCHTVILDTGHAIGVEKPEETNRLLTDFFTEG